MSAHERQKLTARLLRQVEERDRQPDEDQPDPLRVQLERAAERQRERLGRVFGWRQQPNPPPDTRPRGTVDAGEGQPGDYPTEIVHDDEGPKHVRIHDLDSDRKD